MPRSTACRLIVGAYVAACVIALAFIPLSAAAIITPDPLAGVFAVILSLPWSALVVRVVDSSSVPLNMLLAAAGMVLNAWLIGKLCGWVGSMLGSARTR
ncbi:MAG: hypothetical protein AB7E70_16835 [Hyphomicrobiaceae bacterium]